MSCTYQQNVSILHVQFNGFWKTCSLTIQNRSITPFPPNCSHAPGPRQLTFFLSPQTRFIFPGFLVNDIIQYLILSCLVYFGQLVLEIHPWWCMCSFFFIFIAEQYFIVLMDHNLLIHLPSDRHLHYRNNAKDLVVMNKGPINTDTQIKKNSLDIREKQLDQILSIFCTLEETPTCLLVALSSCIPHLVVLFQFSFPHD